MTDKQELRSVQIEDDEMEMSDDDRDYQSSNPKRSRIDNESLKEENDSLRCQLEALRSEMSSVRTDIKYDSDFREKQIKVLQETIRNMQTQLLQMKMREQKDHKSMEQLERQLKEAGVKQLLLKTKIRETAAKLKDCGAGSTSLSMTSEISETLLIDDEENIKIDNKETKDRDKSQDKYENDDIIDIDIDIDNENDNNDDVKIIDETKAEAVEIHKTNDVGGNLKNTEVATENINLIDLERIKDNNLDANEGGGEEENEKDEEKAEVEENQLNNIKENENENKENTKSNILKDNTNHELHNDDNEDQSSVQKDLITDETRGSVTAETRCSTLPLNEAKIIALTVAYLVVQPFGASSESILSYLKNIITSYNNQNNHNHSDNDSNNDHFVMNINDKSLDDILKTYTNLFKAETAIVDENLKIKWKFCAFYEHQKHQQQQLTKKKKRE